MPHDHAVKPKYPAKFFYRLRGFPVRHCESPRCGKQLTPKLYPAGDGVRLEALSEFMRRRYCGNTCSARVRRRPTPKRVTPKPTGRVCERDGCSTPLVRKRFPSGLESPVAFARRRYCSPRCYYAASGKEAPKRKARPLPGRSCARKGCNESITRTRYANGRLEPLTKLEARRYCSLECSRKDAVNAMTRAATKQRHARRERTPLVKPENAPATPRRAARSPGPVRFPQPRQLAPKPERNMSHAVDVEAVSDLPPKRPASLTPAVLTKARALHLAPTLATACVEHPMLAAFMAEIALGEQRGRRMAA